MVAIMYLKSMTIKGFKSFADPVTLVFEPGVTVVVGPNGSGKSNVVDALMWALGVQAAKTVRSSKMDDVIFSGSPARAPLGRAEVSLVICDDSGRLPGGLSEVSITRTLFRSGESEYAMNNHPCRLLDVQDVLSELGIGRRQHVVISQGNLDQILNAQPEERRAVIEEAAGILKHRRRRDKAVKRLEATQSNLERLSGLLRELKRQMRPLERQAKAARAYEAYRDELLIFKSYVTGRELIRLQERRNVLKDQIEHNKEVASELAQSIADADTEIQQAASRISKREIEEISAARSRADSLTERARGLVGIVRERLSTFRSQVDTLLGVDELELLEAEAGSLEGQLDGLEAEELALIPEYERLDIAEKELATLSTSYKDTFGDLDILTAHARDRALIEEAILRLEQEKAVAGRAIEGMEQQEVEGEKRLDLLRVAVAEAEGTLLDIQAHRSSLDDELDRVSSAREIAGKAVEIAEDELRQAERERAGIEARLETLEKAMVDTKDIQLELSEGLSGHVGKLWDLISMDAGMERAVEAAMPFSVLAEVFTMQDGLMDMVLKSLKAGSGISLLPVLASLSSNPLSSNPLSSNPLSSNPLSSNPLSSTYHTPPAASVTHAPSVASTSNPASSSTYPAAMPNPASLSVQNIAGDSSVTSAASSGASDVGSGGSSIPDIASIPGIELLRSHVHSQDGQDESVEHLLDILLEGVWVVHGGREEAARISMSYPRAVIVTQDGDRFSCDGWHIRSSQGVHTYVGRVSVADVELERRRRGEAEARLRSAAMKLDSAREEATASFRLVEELTAEISNLDRQVVVRDADIKQLRYEMSSESDKVARICREKEAKVAEVASMSHELKEFRSKLEGMAGDGVNLADHAERSARAYSDLELKQQSVESLRRKLEIEAAGIAERRVMLQDRLAGIAVKREDYLKREQATRERIEYLELCIAGTEGLERMANDAMIRMEELSNVLRSREDRMSKEFQDDADRLDMLIKDRAKNEATLNELRDHNSELVAALSQDDARAGTLEVVLREELDSSLEDVTNMNIPELEEGMTPEIRIAELEQQIAALGPINALALDELVVLEERYVEMKRQVEDVQHARNEVSRSIDELDVEITRLFTETFEDVNSNFQQILGTLMPGGTGRLELINTENLLECGLEIEARPAGKGVRRLSLLSGGERSLVTLAFLFAIFRSRVSPFYVMDEVEAALDDINLHNFLELARQFRDVAQLIIVSHQKRTMEMADALYGVSMSRDGTSKVVSKRLDEED